MNTCIIGIFLFIANLIVKLLPRVLTTAYSSDTFVLLHISRAIRASRKNPRVAPGLLVDEYHNAQDDYPPLLGFILALIPTRLINKGERFMGALVSSIDVLVVYGFILLFHQPPEVALFAAILYIIMPGPFLPASFLNARIPGILFANVAIACVISFSLEGQWGFLAIFIILGTGIFVLHKFATQAFIVAILSVLVVAEGRAGILLGLGLILLLLAVPLRSHYFRTILPGAIQAWKRHYNNRKQLPKISILLARELWYLPLMPLLVVFFLSDPSFFLNNPLNRLLIAWTLGLHVVAWMTEYIGLLKMLGEGRRYKSYAAFPTAFLVASYYWSQPSLWALVLLLTIGLLCILAIGEQIIRLRKHPTYSPEDFKAMCTILRGLPKDRVWVLARGLNTQILYKTGKKVLAPHSTVSRTKDVDLYPTLQKPYTYIIDKYSIHYLFVDDHFLTISQADLGYYQEVARIGRYSILEILREGSQ